MQGKGGGYRVSSELYKEYLKVKLESVKKKQKIRNKEKKRRINSHLSLRMSKVESQLLTRDTKPERSVFLGSC